MDEQAKDTSRRVTIVGVITLVAVCLYGGGAVWALVHSSLTFTEFSSILGPVVGLLVGYWVRSPG